MCCLMAEKGSTNMALLSYKIGQLENWFSKKWKIGSCSNEWTYVCFVALKSTLWIKRRPENPLFFAWLSVIASFGGLAVSYCGKFYAGNRSTNEKFFFQRNYLQSKLSNIISSLIDIFFHSQIDLVRTVMFFFEDWKKHAYCLLSDDSLDKGVFTLYFYRGSYQNNSS